MNAELSPLGLLGGTFDPIHFAHLRLAQEARDALGLPALRLIPAGQPPHRAQPGCTATDRLAMVRLAVQGLAGFEVDPAEVEAAQPSYTVTTLQRLRSELGAHRPLVLLMGADAFRGLTSWYQWQDLFSHAHIGVATRPGYVLDADSLPPVLAAHWQARRADAAALAQQPAGRIASFGMTALDISATAIRNQLQQGASPRFLLPDAVLDYIQTHHLYRP